MENLTALQMVMRDIEEHYPKLFNIYTQEGREFIARFHKYVEIEKQKIMDAFETAFAEAYKMPTERKFNTAGQYFEETYKTKQHEH